MELPRVWARAKTVGEHLIFLAFALYFIITIIDLFYVPKVDFEVQTTRTGMFQIFWAGADKAYSEKNSVFRRNVEPFKTHQFSIRPSHYNGFLFLPNIHYIRIDPLDGPGEILIKSIHLRQRGFLPINIEKSDDFKHIKAIEGIGNLKIQKDGLLVTTTSNDPKLEIQLSPHFVSDYPSLTPVFICCLLLIYLLRYLANRFYEAEFVDWLFFFVLALIITMAVITSHGMHPDEGVHARAAEYYSHETHWLPPAADAPEIVETYSLHGVSRLNSKEICYLFAGKFLESFSFLPVDRLIVLRFFNISLFILLAVYCLRRPNLRLLSLPLFISPQTWYTFSYFNSDAFALFILFLVAYQVVDSESMLNSYLEGNNTRQKTLLQCLSLGIFLSFIFLVKKNFYFFFVFLVFYYSVQFYFKRYSDPRSVLKRIGYIFVVMSVLLSTHFFLHESVNDWQRNDKIMSMQNQTALEQYNPLRNPVETDKYLNIKGKGLPISYVWEDLQWGHITFMSTFGVYGNMSIYNSSEYYKSIQVFLYCILGCILYDLIVSRRLDNNVLLFASVWICSATLAVASLYNSWVADYQAQGRYLLPILPMVGIFLYSARQRLQRFRINFFTLLLFLFAVSSFYFLGLTNIPKV